MQGKIREHWSTHMQREAEGLRGMIEQALIFPKWSVSPSVRRLSSLKRSMCRGWKGRNNMLWNFTVWSFQRPFPKFHKMASFFFGLLCIYFFKEDRLDGLFVLSLHSEQPVNKEFSAVSSLEATAAVDITCHSWPSCLGMDKSKHMSVGSEKCFILSTWGALKSSG